MSALDHLVNAISISQQMEKCRRLSKFLKGDSYPADMEEKITILKGVMKKHEVSEIGALQLIFDNFPDNGVVQMLFVAAYAEILAPSVELNFG